MPMSNNSKIEWTDATWNPIRARRKDTGKTGFHCERISPGCVNCYAERFNGRVLPSCGTGLPYTVPSRDEVEIYLDHETLIQPWRWKKPRKIFLCSTTDLFADFVPDSMINSIFAAMSLCPRHTFIILTKRSKRMREYFADCADRVKMIGIRTDDSDPVLPLPLPLSNVWIGVSVEDQQRADERIPDLLATPSAVRFVSAEPLLGPVDLSKFLDFNPGPKRPTSSLALNTHGQTGTGLEPGALLSSGDGHAGISPRASGQWRREPSEARVDWVIVGGESGPYARPMHPDWARSLRDQCQEADVPFFFKQWGEWQNGSTLDASKDRIVLNDGRVLKSPYTTDQETRDRWSDYHPCMMAPVGKKKAGRLLHGREWNEFPRGG